MAKTILIFLSFHEPHRLRLPHTLTKSGTPIQGVRDCLIDSKATEHYYRRWLEEVGKPHLSAVTELARAGVKFMLHFSGPLVETMSLFPDTIPADLLTLVRHPNVQLACSSLRHSLSFYLDTEAFYEETRRAKKLLVDLFDVVPTFAVAPFLAMSNEIYYVLGRLGFRGILADGSSGLLNGYSTGYLRKNGAGPYLLLRNSALSHQIAFVRSHRPQAGYTVQTPQVAERIAESPGDFVLLGWQVFPPYGSVETSEGLGFLDSLSDQVLTGALTFSSADDLVSELGRKASPLTLPSIPAVASEFGDISFFLGHPTQQALFRLMHHAYNTAKLSGEEVLVDVAMAMAQWDILGLVHRLLVSGSSGQEPAYLAPLQWKRLGSDGAIGHVWGAYEAFVRYATSLEFHSGGTGTERPVVAPSPELVPSQTRNSKEGHRRARSRPYDAQAVAAGRLQNR